MNERSWIPALAVLVALWAVGCGGTSAGGDDGTDVNPSDDAALADVSLGRDGQATDGAGGADTEVAAAEMPVAACGMAPYELLPTDAVGELLSWEPVDFWDLTPEAFNDLIRGAGYEAMATVKYAVRMYRFRYTTQDRGQLVEATATLTVPALDSPPGDGVPVFLNLHGTTGWSDPCAPSGRPFDTYNALASYFAGMGYVAVSPDYIGLAGFGAPSTVHHAYKGGEQTAIASWDALRAAGRLLYGDLAEQVGMNGQLVIWGGSQGGHAALFTERYGPYYAPEFPVTAVVPLVPGLDLRLYGRRYGTDGALTTPGLLAAALIAQADWYGRGEPADLLTNEPPDYFADNFAATMFSPEECMGGSIPPAERGTMELLFAEGFRDAFDTDEEPQPWRCFLDENSLHTTSVPALRHVPTLVVFGEDDPLVPADLARPAVAALCESGARIQYLECADAPHVEAGVWSIPEQMVWIEARLAGESLVEEDVCSLGAPVCCQGSPAEVCVP